MKFYKISEKIATKKIKIKKIFYLILFFFFCIIYNVVVGKTLSQFVTSLGGQKLCTVKQI
ncbi:MAG: hypothetical protein CVU80_01680 [Elusimicrobia bacterium HGW-Elusimicrobia-4]|nr:MAG: hypothetical protein CVU80_01680 [Elusimicrobia bacterium HGW-Elusimicrobia-4]